MTHIANDREVIPNCTANPYVWRMKHIVTAALLACAAPAGAAPLPDDVIRAELLPGWRTASGTQMSALHLTLAPGWKTYWRAPGEAGIPPEFDWSGSENLGNVAFHWPRPRLVEVNGYRTLAYRNELVLPIEVTPAAKGQPVTLRARINLGICENICVPVTVQVSAALKQGATADPVITSALADQPEEGAALGIPLPVCAVEPIKDGLRLKTDIALPGARHGDLTVVELADRPIWVSPVETRAGDGHLVQTTDLVPADARPFALNRASVRMTVFTEGGRAIELNGCRG